MKKENSRIKDFAPKFSLLAKHFYQSYLSLSIRISYHMEFKRNLMMQRFGGCGF